MDPLCLPFEIQVVLGVVMLSLFANCLISSDAPIGCTPPIRSPYLSEEEIKPLRRSERLKNKK